MTERERKEKMNREEMTDNLGLALAMLRDWIDSEDKWEKCDLTPNDKEACYEFIEVVYEELSLLKDDEPLT